MKRFVLSLAILVIIVCYSASGIFILKEKNNRLINLLNEILYYYNSNDYDKALSLAKSFDKDWYDYERKMSVLVHDNKIQNINMSVAKIKPYLNDKNEELNAEIESICHQIELMYQAEFPTWYNIM